jgi:hypothetical protein
MRMSSSPGHHSFLEVGLPSMRMELDAERDDAGK